MIEEDNRCTVIDDNETNTSSLSYFADVTCSSLVTFRYMRSGADYIRFFTEASEDYRNDI